MEEHAESTRVDILIVDDQERNLDALAFVLNHPDYNIVKARSAREALKHVLDRDFAVILLDVMMPDIDGFECARLLRQRPRSSETSIVFVTAVASDLDFIFKGYSAGAIDYIAKPIEPAVVRAKVAALVSVYRRAEVLRGQLTAMRQFCRHLEAQVEQMTHEFRTLLKTAERRLDDFDTASSKSRWLPTVQ